MLPMPSTILLLSFNINFISARDTQLIPICFICTVQQQPGFDSIYGTTHACLYIHLPVIAKFKVIINYARRNKCPALYKMSWRGTTHVRLNP
jgi:hypothetical protein